MRTYFYYSILSLFFMFLLSKSVLSAPYQRVILANGFEAILIENRSIPMVACVVTIRAGSSNEEIKINGISHMLEHLLFNGTKRRSQKELYEEVDFYGIYNNAHTGRDFTNFIVLAEKGNIERAIDIQSDMLFNSTIPADKFEKEKGIILNEIARDMSSPGFFPEEQFNRIFFSDTPYNLPVIGTPDSIKNMKRETVLGFYRRYYVPNNGSAIIMGDFEPVEMVKMLDRFFGSFSPGEIPVPPSISLNKESVNSYITSKMKVKNSTIDFGAAIPSIDNKDFYPLTLLGMLFDSDLKTRINKRLTKLKAKEIISAWAAVDFNRKFSIFRTEITFSPETDPKLISRVFKEEIRDFALRPVDMEKVKGLLISSRVEEINLYEKPHYYGMMKGKFIAAGGWDFTKNFLDKLETSRTSLDSVLKKYFPKMEFMTSLVTPGELGYKDIKDKIITDYYSYDNSVPPEFTKQSKSITKKWEKGDRSYILPPFKKERSSELSLTHEKSIIKRVVLNNALTLIVSSNPYSDVFAMHFLAKNRSAIEPKSKTGIADFLHRLIKRGSENMDEAQLKSRLSSIGAVLKTHDNPYIPYDDHYTSNEYSYIRFGTIDRYIGEAISIFSEIIRRPSTKKSDIEQVREEMLALIRERDADPRKLSDSLFYKNIFKTNPQAQDVMGTEETIRSISSQDIKEFHEKYFSPGNLILSVATSRPVEEVVDKIKAGLGEWKNIPFSLPKTDFSSLTGRKNIQFNKKLGQPQAYLRIGKVFKVAKHDKPALRVFGSILSEKMSFELREKMGISYSLGAGYSFFDDYGLFKVSIGTTPKTLKKAKDGVLKWLKEMRDIKVEQRDLERQINVYISRTIMRQLSRINQAYYIGLEDFYNLPTGTFKKRIFDLKKVTPKDVKSVAKKYITIKGLTEVSVM